MFVLFCLKSVSQGAPNTVNKGVATSVIHICATERVINKKDIGMVQKQIEEWLLSAKQTDSALDLDGVGVFARIDDCLMKVFH